mgnify:CR=1 FL=1
MSISADETKKYLAHYFPDLPTFSTIPDTVEQPMLYVLPDSLKHHYETWSHTPCYAILFPPITINPVFATEVRVRYDTEVWYVGLNEQGRAELLKISEGGTTKEKSMDLQDAYLLTKEEGFPYPSDNS